MIALFIHYTMYGILSVLKIFSKPLLNEFRSLFDPTEIEIIGTITKSAMKDIWYIFFGVSLAKVEKCMAILMSPSIASQVCFFPTEGRKNYSKTNNF